MWVGGIGDCGCGSMGCVDSGVIGLFFGVFFTGNFFFFFGWMLVSILLHNGRPKASILMMVVADDGGCVGCVGSVREMIMLKK